MKQRQQFKHCRKMSVSRVLALLSLLLLLAIGGIMLIVGINYLIQFNFVAAILSFLCGFLMLWFGRMEYRFEARKYMITPEGLMLGKHQKAFYTWQQIHEIGIYPFDAASSLEVFDKVICCSFVPPGANFKDKLFRNPHFYAQRNLDQFVIIDYDDDIVDTLGGIYPKNIIDHTVGIKGYIRNHKLKPTKGA